MTERSKRRTHSQLVPSVNPVNHLNTIQYGLEVEFTQTSFRNKKIYHKNIDKEIFYQLKLDEIQKGLKLDFTSESAFEYGNNKDHPYHEYFLEAQVGIFEHDIDKKTTKKNFDYIFDLLETEYKNVCQKNKSIFSDSSDKKFEI